MNKFRRKAKKSLLGALSLLSAFSSVAPMSAMNDRNGEVGINVDYDDDDLSGYDADDEREDGVSPESRKPGLSTAAKVGIGVGVGGAAALGIGLLASYLSKSDGEIGKKITIEDIDLQNRYNDGAIVGFAVGDKIDSAIMKQYFPNSQSKIKDGFNYEYLGGKEFKVVDIYLNIGESCVYLGADIKNSPTLKNMNENNGNPIDSKAHYKVTRTGNNYNIEKSDVPNLNPPVAPVVPVQNLPNQQQPVTPPQLPPADNLPRLYTLDEVLALANSASFTYDLTELDPFGQDGLLFLYEIDGTAKKIKKSTLNINVFSGFYDRTYELTRPNISGQVLTNTLKRFPNKCKLYGPFHKLDSTLKYDIDFVYDRETKGMKICPRLTAGQIISASKAHELEIMNEEPQSDVFFLIDNNHVPQVSNDVAVFGNHLFEENKVRYNLNPGIIYVLDNNNQFAVHDINKEYLRSHKNNPFTVAELSDCVSLKERLIPGTSLKFRDFNEIQYTVMPSVVSFVSLDCEITDLDNLSVRLVSSAPLDTFTNLSEDALSTFKIYENSDSLTPLTAQQLRTVQAGRRIRQDQRTGRLHLTRMNGDLSREEKRIFTPPQIPNMIPDDTAIPGIYGPGDINTLGQNIANLTNNNIERWSVTKYLNHLIDAPAAQHCCIGVVGGNDIFPDQICSHSLNLQYFEDMFGPRGLLAGLRLGARYVRKRRVRGVDGNNNIYNLYEIVAFTQEGPTYIPRYASLAIPVGTQGYFNHDNMVGEPQFIQGATDRLNLKIMPFDTWFAL